MSLMNHHEIYLLLKLIFNFLNHAVWPIVIVFILLFFRKKINSLIDSLPTILNKHDVSVSMGSFSVDWSTDWSTIEKIARDNPSSEPDSETTKVLSPKEIKMSSPLDTIIRSSIHLEQVMNEINIHNYDSDNRMRSPLILIRKLKDDHLISDELFHQIRELQFMRNRIVHGAVDLESLTVEKASSYEIAVNSVIKKIRNINSHAPREISLFDFQNP